MNPPIFFNLNPVNFFIISGVIQNFILTTILFFRSSERRMANKLIATAILIVNLHLSYLMLLDTNLDNMFPWLLWFPFSGLTAIGPLIFFYTRTLTGSNFTLREALQHFIPFACELIAQAVMITYSISHETLMYNTPFYFYVIPLVYVWTAASIIYYLRRSLHIIHHHESWALGNFSNLKEITLKWLQKLIVYYRVLWIVWVPFISTFLVFFRFQLLYLVIVLVLYLLALALTYLTSWIGLQAMMHMNAPASSVEERKPENKNFSRLSGSDIHSFAERITTLMTVEKIYLNENLNLKDLAHRVQADPNLVSYILNNHFQKNFHDFVNHYRIDEVKDRLKDPTHNYLTILGIALESGFNSKTTFNRVFRQMTGMTPTEYQKKRPKNVVPSSEM